ncbi:hypothetical protein HDU84_005302 [Entophlyctis sp. JEL0112]|nr:hypothetical protein HDU84_005302 [Entophlyctis sp. JEL0112]
MFLATNSGALYFFGLKKSRESDRLTAVRLQMLISGESTSVFNARPQTLAILNQDGLPVPEHSDSRDSEHYLVFVGPKMVTVFLISPESKNIIRLAEKNCDGSLTKPLGWIGKIFEGMLKKEVEKDIKTSSISKARLIKMKNNDPALMILDSEGYISLLRLPDLEILSNSSVAQGILTSLDASWILSDTSIGVWYENRMLCVVGQSQTRLLKRGELYDFGLQKHFWESEGGRSLEFNELFETSVLTGSESMSHSSPLLPSQASLSSSSGNREPPSPQGLSPAVGIQEARNKLNERGEKLANLGKKMADASQQSADFLRTVQEYNERQARKKWYEL